jgi:hypothetical protein
MRIKKFVLSCIMGFVSVAGAAFANQVEFLFIYPPGGGTDVQASAVISDLEKNGIVVKKSFFKTCTDAVRYSQNKNNTFIVTVAADWNFSNTNEGANCPPLVRQSGKILPYSRLSELPSYVCSVPGSAIKTVSDVKNSQRRIAVATPFPSATKFVQQFAELTGKSDLIKVVPYPGAQGVKLAVTAKDVELFFTGSHYKSFIKDGATCFASTARNAINGIPYLGDLAQVPALKENLSIFVLMSVGNIDDNVTKKIKVALQSEDFLNVLRMSDALHNGLGKGETASQLNDFLKSQQ